MRQKKSKLRRKASRIESNENVKKFNSALGEPLRKRDKRLFEASQNFDKAIAAARKELVRERKEAWDDYTEERNALIKKYATVEAIENV